jgi:hypothetical protein
MMCSPSRSRLATRAGAIRRRRIYRSALAVLGGADRRGGDPRAPHALATRAGLRRRLAHRASSPTPAAPDRRKPILAMPADGRVSRRRPFFPDLPQLNGGFVDVQSVRCHGRWRSWAFSLIEPVFPDEAERFHHDGQTGSGAELMLDFSDCQQPLVGTECRAHPE